jgi:hypothetical protein
MRQASELAVPAASRLSDLTVRMAVPNIADLRSIVTASLDMSQKLFGRGFLFAAFIPSALFVAGTSYLLLGYEAVRAQVLSTAQREWWEVIFQFGLILGAVFLLAFMLHSTRAGLHRIFRGQWSGPLGLLHAVGFFAETRALRRAEARLKEKEEALNVPKWATDFGFIPTSSVVIYAEPDARKQLAKVQRRHNELRTSLPDGPWKESDYWAILTTARLLQANTENYAADLKQSIDVLVAEIKQDYAQHPALAVAVAHLNARAMREWAEAYEEQESNFPEDERWLRPTRVGNIVATLELYPLKRYGIALGAIWPRLLAVVPEDARLRAEDANTYLDFTAVMVLLSLAEAAIAFATLFVGPPRVRLLSLVLALALLLATWLFYRLMREATRAYLAQLQVAIDLYRLKLLEKLEIELPKNPEEEVKIWTELRYFIAEGTIPKEHIRFKGAKQDAPPPPPKPWWKRLLGL